jgi:Ni,Fe-hydrogenase III component G
MSEVLRRFLEKFADSESWEWSPHRMYLTVSREEIAQAAQFLFREVGCRFSIATGIDTRDGFEILYHFSHDATGVIYTLKTLVPKDDLKIDSITPVVPAANWIEREMRELLGIEFTGHPNPKPLLTSDVEWEPGTYPLRRDYDREPDVKPKPWDRP